MEYLLTWYGWVRQRWEKKSKTISHIPKDEDELSLILPQDAFLDAVTITIQMSAEEKDLPSASGVLGHILVA